jgi:hypothetical protein
MTTNKISANKFNEITYAIAQLEEVIGYTSEAHERVYSRYPADVVAAYKAKCAEMDAADAASSDTEGTY